MQATRRTLIFLVTEDWYFLSHRLPAAEAARAEGFDVAVATRVRRHGAAIEKLGYRLLPLGWQRRSLNPLAALGAILEIRRLYRRERPALVHHVALKPAVLGGLAALAAGVPGIVTTLAGLGAALSPDTLVAALGRRAVKLVLRLVELRLPAMIVVQNRSDEAVLRHGWPALRNVTLIAGSGVDTARFSVLPEPAGPVVCAQVSRMLTIKGVEELVAAVRLVRAQGIDLRLLLAGMPDPDSHASLSEAWLAGLAREPGIEWLGQVEDVRQVWQRAHIGVLASWGGEGVPKTLLEAAACGRPLVATDVPGCRDVVEHAGSGLLVPPRDAASLAGALAMLAQDPARRASMGTAAAQRVRTGFAAAEVTRRSAALYRLLAGAGDRFGPVSSAAN